MSGAIVPGDLVMVVRGEYAGATGLVLDRLRVRRVRMLPNNVLLERSTWLVLMARPICGERRWAWGRGEIVKIADGRALDAVARTVESRV